MSVVDLCSLLQGFPNTGFVAYLPKGVGTENCSEHSICTYKRPPISVFSLLAGRRPYSLLRFVFWGKARVGLRSLGVYRAVDH